MRPTSLNKIKTVRNVVATMLDTDTPPLQCMQSLSKKYAQEDSDSEYNMDYPTLHQKTQTQNIRYG